MDCVCQGGGWGGRLGVSSASWREGIFKLNMENGVAYFMRYGTRDGEEEKKKRETDRQKKSEKHSRAERQAEKGVKNKKRNKKKNCCWFIFIVMKAEWH